MSDEQIIDNAAADLERVLRQAELGGKLGALLNRYQFEEGIDVMIDMLAISCLTASPRKKDTAIRMAEEIAALIPKAAERMWGSPGHQKLLGNLAREMN